MAESVKVIVRCRPMNKRENDLCSRCVVFMDNETCSCSVVNPDDNHAPPKTFTFDGVYDTDSTTEQIYNDIGYPLVESVLEGYNSTVFAYGQTGCGKSFTMQGVVNPPSQRGIIPRAFEHIFEAVSVAESTKYLVLASYLEIYNEDIRDLLGNDVKRRLDLKEHSEKGIYVQGATGERLKEATKINLSLSALGNVISALVDGKSKHIPYRDSKLTRLLQDSLGGNTKTLMVACLSPADNNYDETLSTLRYANRAKNIQNKPRINEDPKDTMLREYQDEIKKLRAMLDGTQYLNSDSMGISAASLLEEEREKVRREYEEKMQQMREHYEAEQNHKYKLQEDMQQLKYHYEEELKKISEQEKQTLLNGKSPTFAVSSPVGGTPAEIVDALKKEKKTITPAQQEILSRLQKLQKSMVGGERANDSEAKERRMRKKRASERRLQALAQVLSKVDDDDGVVLQVYDDIEQRLRNTTETLRKYRNRVLEEKEKFQEQEKQYEIEKNKLRKDCMKYKQIAEKIAETWVPEGCNYKHIEEIKREMFFDEANQNYILPPAKFDEKRQNRTHNLLPAASPLHLHSSRSSGSSDKSSKSSSPPKNRMCSPEFLEDEDRSIIQKLQRSEEEDIAGNYFKPKRATELLNRAKEDASRAFNTWRGNGTDISPELSIRRPIRLQALPVLEKSTVERGKMENPS